MNATQIALNTAVNITLNICAISIRLHQLGRLIGSDYPPEWDHTNLDADQQEFISLHNLYTQCLGSATYSNQLAHGIPALHANIALYDIFRGMTYIGPYSITAQPFPNYDNFRAFGSLWITSYNNEARVNIYSVFANRMSSHLYLQEIVNTFPHELHQPNYITINQST